jgi:hypothetical protein
VYGVSVNTSNGRGPWYWLTVISPLLGSLGARGAGREAQDESDAALRDLLPIFLVIGAILVGVLVIAAVRIV